MVLEQIHFRKPDHMGVEQEFFLIDKKAYEKGIILPVPKAKEFLRRISGYYLNNEWTYELSACQVEYRTDPHLDLNDIIFELKQAFDTGSSLAHEMGCCLYAVDVIDIPNFPMDIYPTKRYKEISKFMARDVLLAALQVTGIHIHYGCRDLIHALAVYNILVEYIVCFMEMGDSSNGKRLDLYKKVAPNMMPPFFENTSDFEKKVAVFGSLSNCWYLIRITRYGTVEIRAFGSVSNYDKVLNWLKEVKRIVSNI